jgi:hypothetical protein
LDTDPEPSGKEKDQDLIPPSCEPSRPTSCTR